MEKIDHTRSKSPLRDLPREIEECRRIILGEIKDRSQWFIRLRWWVPPAIASGTVLALWAGMRVETGTLLGVALFVLVYNVFFDLRSRGLTLNSVEDTVPFQRFISWQVSFDYGATFLLLHLTGGAASPFIFLFIFHVIFTAILLPRRWACAFAAVVPVGIGVVGGFEYAGWISHHPLVFQGAAIDMVQQPFHLVMVIVFLAGFVLIASFSVSAIMTLLRERITDLADLSQAVTGLNAKLETLMEERTRFMRKVAHNLRAPLSGVMSMLEVLRGDHLGGLNEAQLQYLGRVDQRVRAMVQMINELMMLARSRTEKIDSGWKEFPVASIPRRIEQTFEDEAKKKKLAFTVSASDDLPQMRGDEEMIGELFENLVSNAIKYTPERGSVSVRFSSGGSGLVEVEVTDSGIGIPADETPLLFNEFFRGRNVRDIVGTGLGLAIVKEVVDRHGGRIEVTSGEKTGTTFRVLLPVDPPLIVKAS
jgi:signal transduction histidine kinase